jgi:hypothetical protein
MFFILSFGYDIKLGKATAFQEWLADHEGEWRAAMPEGTEYIGTFAAVHSSEKQAGDTFTLYRLDSYGAQDRLAAAMKDGPLAKIMADSGEFVDLDSKDWSQMLLKSWVDATVWDPA